LNILILDTDAWNQIVVENRNKLNNNNFHSLSRFQLYQISNSDTINDLTKKTEELHLFYKAESCAMQVLSANALKISTLFIAFIMAFIL